MLNPEDVYKVYVKKSDGNRRLVGKFAIVGNELHILSDYFNYLHPRLNEGEVTKETLDDISKLRSSSYFEAISLKEEAEEERAKQQSSDLGSDVPEFSQDGNVSGNPILYQEKKKPDPVFIYQHYKSIPHELSFRNGKWLLDGTEIPKEAVEHFLSVTHSGEAYLRYKQDMAKSDTTFQRLMKAGSKATASMAHLRTLVDQGIVPQEHYDNIRRELFEDEMIPGIGNKRAYRDFMENNPNPQGVHVMMDMNGLKSLNDELGHEHGDHAISAAGQALRTAIDNTVGTDNAKAWRFGGDEMAFHVPDHESASRVLRAYRDELDKVPHLAGTHKLSMSAGIGPSPELADKALYHAKGHVKTDIAALGGDPTARVSNVRAPNALYAHSLQPGHEGRVGISNPSPVAALKPPAPEKPATPEIPKTPAPQPVPAHPVA